MKVAVKVWVKPLQGEQKKQFDREVNIQKCLNHPNCIKLYGRGWIDEDRPFLVMELADHSLADYTIDKQPGLSLTNQQKCSVITQIASGLVYLHSLGLVHRDIKCENILMVGLTPKIADFGFSRIVDTSRSMCVSRIGTPLLYINK